MQTNSNISQLLDSLETSPGINPALDRPQIEREIIDDADTYKGLGIKVLSIVGGLLGTGFFLGFVLLAISSSEELTLALGFTLTAGAIFVSKQSKHTVLDTACIATYLAGYAMVGYGLSKQIGDNMLTCTLLTLALVTPILTSGFMLNFFSVLLINGGIFALININSVYQLVHVFTAVLAAAYVALALFEPQLIAYNKGINKRYMAWLNGLLFSFIALLAYLGINELHSRQLTNGYVTALILILLTGFVLTRIISQAVKPDTGSRATIYAIGVLVLVSTVFAPAISGSLLIILVSYRVGHHTGLIVGIIALVYFTGQYYYDLSYTLLVKSEIMVASGILFLVAWALLKNQLKRYEHN